jgi:hypothetical protein
MDPGPLEQMQRTDRFKSVVLDYMVKMGWNA